MYIVPENYPIDELTNLSARLQDRGIVGCSVFRFDSGTRHVAFYSQLPSLIPLSQTEISNPILGR